MEDVKRYGKSLREECTLPPEFLKYERWIRRYQKDFRCTMDPWIGEECNCNRENQKPFYKFWTCNKSVHKTWVRVFDQKQTS